MNCEKDALLDIPQASIGKNIYKIKRVKLSEIPKIKNFILDKTTPTFFSKSTEIDGAIFDDDNIIEVIDTLNHTNYTFRFTYPDTPVGTFYNLVVGKTPEGENITPYVLKYICDETQFDEYIATNFTFSSFKGKVGIHKYTDFFQVGSILKNDPNCPENTDANGDPVACDTANVDGSGTSSGSGDSDNSSGPTGGGVTNGGSGASTCSLEITYEPCGCGGNADGHAPSGSPCCSGSSSTLTINCPDLKSFSTKSGEDCPDCPNPNGGVGILSDVNVSQELINILGSGVSELLIELDAQTKLDLYNLLNASANSDGTYPQEIINIEIEAINNLVSYTSSNYPGKDDGLPFKWWIDNNFIINSGNFDLPSDIPNTPDEAPNVAEAFLYALFPKEAVLHIKNAATALVGAQLIADNFSDGTIGLNDGKADAFRHAYWNALDTAELGPLITKLFTDAHESGGNDLASAMDLYNNAIGIAIAIQNVYIFTTNIFIIANDIEQAILDGQLKYINSNGLLVFTNQ